MGSVLSQSSKAVHDPQYKPVGIAYLKIAPDGTIDLRILYQGQVGDPVKSDIAATFGVGAMEWKP